MKSLIIFLVLLTYSTLFFYSCTPIDNSNEVGRIISNSEHFIDPLEYAPIPISDTIKTTINDNGVEYKKTEISYKFGKKFDNKVEINTSKNKNLKSSDNDIYLGAIIQGKYWYNDGNLISIGNFNRNTMTITLQGINITGASNSIPSVYPSMAEMTDAINSLLNVNDFSLNTNNYQYIITEANTKEQISLNFGLKPSWVENMGLNLNFTNTYTTNTVYVYFKQIFYTISSELPAQPSDFFSNTVDVEALKTKITQDNPAGYISSIDYGRIIVVKMSSSSNKKNMKLALDAAFQNLSANIDAEYDNIIQNSTFEAQIYGGNSSQIIHSLDEVIDFINQGLTMSYLTEAVPIIYHTHYLDGAPFNIGEEIKYTETDYQITNANSMLIKNITITQLPHMIDGYWEPGLGGGSWPDVYFTIYNNNQTVYSKVNEYKNETTQNMLDNKSVTWSTNFEITSFDDDFYINIFDYDSGDDDFMGQLKLNVNENINNNNNYPSSITLYDSNAGIRITLKIEWQ